MRVAIIGAGAAGLCVAKTCLKENFDVDIFEKSENIGGTWNYTDCIEVDEKGQEVHTSMYKGLRTNIPKELMEYEDFPYPEQVTSYVYQDEVLDYLKSYSKFFEITPHIWFLTQVTNVEPKGAKWLVEVENIKTSKKEQLAYDAVCVCNGHYKEIFVPEVVGIESFLGNCTHSHNYRTPDQYTNKRVLVLGAGPSGIDISRLIEPVAKKVFVSYRPNATFAPIPDGVASRPLLKELDGNEAVFEDGSREEIDEILFCTGYRYSLPFISEKCNINTDGNYVHPLYKQVISIENPTLGFIGLPFDVCSFLTFNIQVRFFVSTLNGHFGLPPKEEMLADFREDLKRKSQKPLRHFHRIGDSQRLYFDDLAETANIKKIPPVLSKLFKRVRMNRNLDDCFKIVDDDNFIQIR